MNRTEKNSEKAHVFVRQFGKYTARLAILPTPYINPPHADWSPNKPEDRAAFGAEYGDWMMDSYKTAAREFGHPCITATVKGSDVDGWAVLPDGGIIRISSRPPNAATN